MVPEIWIFCHFGHFFANFEKIKKTKQTNKNKNKKPPGDIIILHKCTKNHDHMLHCSSDMLCDRLFFILGYFLHFHSPKGLKNKK